MSESIVSVLIAAGILIVLALFVPCMESLARLLRGIARRRNAADGKRPAESYKRNIA